MIVENQPACLRVHILPPPLYSIYIYIFIYACRCKVIYLALNMYYLYIQFRTQYRSVLMFVYAPLRIPRTQIQGIYMESVLCFGVHIRHVGVPGPLGYVVILYDESHLQTC